MSHPTWDEIRARSEQVLGVLKVFCGDCDIAFHHGGLPCRKHATPEEIETIDRAVEAAMNRLADHPLVRRINHSVGWDE